VLRSSRLLEGRYRFEEPGALQSRHVFADMPIRLTSSHRRTLLLSAFAAAALCVLSIFAFDGPTAAALSSLSSESRRGIQRLVTAFELVFAFGVSPYLYGLLVAVAGTLTLVIRKGGVLPWALLFIGLSHVTARFLADILKPPFSRLRPFEALTSSGWQDAWFAPVGNSFPSGHAVHFWSLFFPLAILFPRYGPALVVLPIVISVARIAVNDHYLSDIFASVAIAALVTWAFAVTVLDRGVRPTSAIH
jgi:membrane-associated phospholipid phosphatase